MAIKVNRPDPASDLAVLEIEGRLVMGMETVRLEEQARQLREQNVRKLVLDLSNLLYLDSSGLGAVASCVSIIRGAGGEVRLAGLCPRVEQILEMTGMKAVFDVYPDVESACKGF